MFSKEFSYVHLQNISKYSKKTVILFNIITIKNNCFPFKLFIPVSAKTFLTDVNLLCHMILHKC